MKKIVVGIVWQIMGFLVTGGLWFYAARIRWGDNIIKTLMDANLILLFIIGITLFVFGILICLDDIKKNTK